MGRKLVVDSKLVTFVYHFFCFKPWEIMETIFFNPSQTSPKREKRPPSAEKKLI